MTSKEQNKWEYTRQSLKALEDILRCWECSKVASDPQEFGMCGHFLCLGCVNSAKTCPICSVPSQASEVVPDRLVNSLIAGFRDISSVVAGTEKEEPVEAAVLNSVVLIQENKSTIGSPVPIEKISELVLEENKATAPEEVCPPAKRSLRGKLALSKQGKVNPTLPKISPAQSDKITNSNKPRRTEVSNNPVTPSSSRKSAGGKKLLKIDSAECPPPSSTRRPCTPLRKSSTPGKDLVKRNHKGETSLHTACIKGDVSRVRALLDAGAPLNAKDNAGWTPLHEAVVNGHTEVVQMLLDAGVLVNVPGDDNVTPLHEAVIKQSVPIIQLLVAHGADTDARTSAGKTARDFAVTEEVKNALNTQQLQLSRTTVKDAESPGVKTDVVVYASSDLPSESKSILSKFSTQLKIKLAASFRPEVTHLVVPVDKNSTCSPSLNVLIAILRGLWILTHDWIAICIENGFVVDPGVFEVAGVTDYQDSNAPQKGRLNAQKQFPGLFNGCHIFLLPNVSLTLGSCELFKPQLVTLIKEGEGIVLTREPHPEAIPDSERTVPYHAQRAGALANTSHFIIYAFGKSEPKLKYKMSHIKTLPVNWLIDCILHCSLIEPYE